MYARLLFVVVGILEPVLARLTSFPTVLRPVLPTAFVALRLGIAGAGGYTLAA
jgi:hypothetical protein